MILKGQIDNAGQIIVLRGVIRLKLHEAWFSSKFN